MSPLGQFLDEVDRAGIPHVSWKNNHELDAYLAGRGDLDLFVAPDYRTAFFVQAQIHGWLELENPIARYPFLVHFFKVAGSGKIYHLHVYFRIITGESWIKEYLLPLEKFLLENRTRTTQSKIWVLNNTAQRYLFGLRHLLKGGSIVSRYLYWREINSYWREWKACDGDERWEADMGPVALSGFRTGARLRADKIALPTLWAAIRLRWALLPFLRVAPWSLPGRRIFSFCKRLYNKLVLKRKKIFPRSGLVIAISGVDGAGKSTLLNEIYSVFSEFLTTRRFQLGRPQSVFVDKVYHLVARRSSVVSLTNIDLSPERIFQPSLIRCLSAAVLALLRLRAARRALRAARRGCLVLVDRWPTAELSKMDGPRIIGVGDGPHFYHNILKSFERWAYSRMPQADVCIFLTVKLDTALARNRSRVKDKKESDEEISRRFIENENTSPIANKVIRLKNDADFVEVREELIKVVWSEIINH
jgi:thymidylate kinase